MGNDGGPEAPGDAAQLKALEARAARLESELAGLRRDIAAALHAAVPAIEVPAAVAVPPPPPPMPLPREVPAERPVTGAVAGLAWPVAEPAAAAPKYERAAAHDSFENRLGSQIFNRVGIVLLLIGTAWFLKLAVDRRWIVPSPMGRLIAGLIAGAAIVLWSERFRRKGFAAFSYSLKALGSGVLYLSLWAGFQLFHLLPAGAALGLMVLVTAWNAYMAWVQDAELLAAYALAGGFLTPLLVSSGGNHETFLFSYLLAIDIATVVLVRLRRWPRLLLAAFPLTVAFFIAWYAEFFVAAELVQTAVFIILFDSTFSSVALRREEADSRAGKIAGSAVIEDILLPLATSAYLSLSLYSVLQDSGHHALLPWLMVLLAATYLGFIRLPQSRTASAIHLSLAVVYLTIAVPLKVSGHWITVSWLVEGLALLWVAIRLSSTREGEASDGYASHTLRWLACASLGLGFCGVLAHSVGFDLLAARPFLNADTATVLTGTAVFSAAVWLALLAGGRADRDSLAWGGIARLAFGAVGLTGLLLVLREIFGATSASLGHPPFRTAEFWTAVVGLAVFAGVIAVSLRLAQGPRDIAFWTRSAAVGTVAFNLIAVLTGVREVSAIWEAAVGSTARNPDAALQQALAISGFLMLYGAALLAVGFWKRVAFLRWQALVLLVFTIFKTFLYDMRSLSQGYRVVSFLALGALLMAISFAYQKDWLNLRASDDAAEAVSSGAQR